MAKNKIVKWIKDQLQDKIDERQKKSIARAVEFAKKNRNCLILVLDIKSDDIVCAWRDHYMSGRFLTRFLHLKQNVVKAILLGRANEKRQNMMIHKVKEFVGEFLWQMGEHAYEKARSKSQKKLKSK